MQVGIAVDLGTTTVGVSILELDQGRELQAFSFANPQYVYGTDVITRIRNCTENPEMLTRMGELLRSKLFSELKERTGIPEGGISEIVYSGNTAMLHIFRGMSVDGLGAHPFRPVSLAYACQETGSEYGAWSETFLPGFSAFVGADILSGAWYLGMGASAQYELLVDLGTNGELLLLNEKGGYAASTACGSVFDHTGSGAAYGSETIRVIAAARRRRILDTTGRLKPPLDQSGIGIEKGYVLRQHHIRSFQLAKGAIRAGITCLLDKAGVTAQDVGRVCISGGLGFYMDPADAFTVGLLPEEFRSRLEVTGNTSLYGAKKMILERNRNMAMRQMDDIISRTESFELALFPDFQKIYLESMGL